MTNKMDELLEAVMYFPAKPKQIYINPKDEEPFTYVDYIFLSGKVRKVKTLIDVIRDEEFKYERQSLFSANQLQTGEIIVVRIHPADSLISIERRSK
ncbi:MAG: hypothetical protein IKB64_09890 [Paludibacteraceae bacterium]|nr:hypothetical protein [Paludibacteraceae bacterium]